MLFRSAEVCSRCQHKPATAMASYVRRGLAALGGTGESEEEIESGGTETEPAGEDETAGEAEGSEARRVGKQRSARWSAGRGHGTKGKTATDEASELRY